ncbi:MAG TPA: pyridoxal-phosphate dependent enzyme [Flavobacteriaceae bacterium]|nr:pyridoxal-phosphate dependent enzyme [Flavobacteriaceae bacterium]
MMQFIAQSNLNVENQVFLKPEYLLHQHISGNKYRKLKYNIQEAKTLQKDTLLTFGGAFSNHIAAVASAGKEFGFKTIGVIRGEELIDKIDLNPTLAFAKSCGMEFCFVTREQYQNKASEVFINDLKTQYGDFYLLPEGGTNELAVKGCEEILTEYDTEFTHICCPVGTGGTISGLINRALPHQKVLGFPALKGSFLTAEICKFAQRDNWGLITDYHFGGYAKINPELVTFINRFKTQCGIPLDPIYTGKMLYGVFDLLKQNYFKPTDKILVIHTGGLQGIAGMNQKLKAKGWPEIII